MTTGSAEPSPLVRNPHLPWLAAAERLLDAVRLKGFRFERVAPGDDGPLRGVRATPDHVDEIFIGGFSSSCWATRKRRYSVIVPKGLPVVAEISGDALVVLQQVNEWTVP